MLTSTVFHEDVFYEHFRPFRHQLARYNIWGGHGLETFGDDLLLAFNYDYDYVWTVVDGDEGLDQWIPPRLSSCQSHLLSAYGGCSLRCAH